MRCIQLSFTPLLTGTPRTHPCLPLSSVCRLLSSPLSLSCSLKDGPVATYLLGLGLGLKGPECDIITMPRYTEVSLLRDVCGLLKHLVSDLNLSIEFGA